MSTEIKTLKSEYPTEWNGFEVRELPIEDIWQSVPIAENIAGKPFYSRVKSDIKMNGMHFPIMCVHTNYRTLEEAKERWSKEINELPFWHNTLGKHKKMIWSVWGGSNRLAIAKDVGYTHIDAAVLPSIAKAISMQKWMRKPFEDTYYK